MFLLSVRSCDPPQDMTPCYRARYIIPILYCQIFLQSPNKIIILWYYFCMSTARIKEAKRI